MIVLETSNAYFTDHLPTEYLQTAASVRKNVCFLSVLNFVVNFITFGRVRLHVFHYHTKLIYFIKIQKKPFTDFLQNWCT